MEPRKQAILNALHAHVRQRSGMDWRNYGDRKSYRADQRSITQNLRDFRELARAVELHVSITAEDLLEAARRAYSGRLDLEEQPDGRVRVEYRTGQYFPTEYRAAACAVLAAALWEWQGGCMPPRTVARAPRRPHGPGLATLDKRPVLGHYEMKRNP